MENPIRVKSSDQLESLLTSSGGRVVFILYITKRCQNCRRALTGFESASSNHEAAATFGVVEQDTFSGESAYVDGVTSVPRFEAYLNGTSIGSYQTIESKEIDRFVVTSINRARSNRGQPMGSPAAATVGSSVAMMNPNQIREKILQNARANNPALFGQLVSNPQMLNMAVQREFNNMQMAQQQKAVQQWNQQTETLASAPVASAATTATSSSTHALLPTFEQIKYHFEIFKSLQKMGVLDTAVPTPEPVDLTKTITLPDGTKVVPLSDGNYGVIG